LYFSVGLNICENWDAWGRVESTNKKRNSGEGGYIQEAVRDEKGVLLKMNYPLGVFSKMFF
ncbi:MAG TPA: hypothetical protein VJJ26_01570, partial [Candidatus Babeliales bacterium]|nr:hypothetical protein [Candidatus Babeliales bacterium]